MDFDLDGPDRTTFRDSDNVRICHGEKGATDTVPGDVERSRARRPAQCKPRCHRPLRPFSRRKNKPAVSVRKRLKGNDASRISIVKQRCRKLTHVRPDVQNETDVKTFQEMHDSKFRDGEKVCSTSIDPKVSGKLSRDAENHVLSGHDLQLNSDSRAVNLIACH